MVNKIQKKRKFACWRSILWPTRSRSLEINQNHLVSTNWPKIQRNVPSNSKVKPPWKTLGHQWFHLPDPTWSKIAKTSWMSCKTRNKFKLNSLLLSENKWANFLVTRKKLQGFSDQNRKITKMPKKKSKHFSQRYKIKKQRWRNLSLNLLNKLNHKVWTKCEKLLRDATKLFRQHPKNKLLKVTTRHLWLSP